MFNPYGSSSVSVDAETPDIIIVMGMTAKMEQGFPDMPR